MKLLTQKSDFKKQAIHWLMFTFCYLPITALSQTEPSEGAEEAIKHHRVMLVLSHTHVPSGIDSDGSKSWIASPSWGLDYDYRFNETWSLGIHTDMVLENFEFEDSDEIVQKRSSPFAIALIPSYKFGAHFSVMAGGGVEFAAEQNLALVRIGAEYGWELPKDWELGISLVSDIKIGSHNSWCLGFGIGKLF
ncbi:hypothetical protein [Gelidibacter mesophilus]|uniref:hypothetical protein n=1 Tax=Gelidibacter mesophilus TaxID=169050 RepID=UPI0003FC01BE|nr:hypothetical protein [Gelidibacter mesophilus]